MTKRSILLPRTCTAYTVACVLGSILPTTLYAALLTATLIAVAVSASEQGLRSIALASGATVPFLPLLAIVHSFINPMFPVEYQVAGVLDFRPQGLAFAVLTTTRIGILMLGVVVWRNVQRNEFSAFVLSKKAIPASIAIVLLQAASLFKVLSERITAILSAQRSRGVPIKRSLFDKIRYLPACFVPLVTGTIIEAEARYIALENRGLGSGRIRMQYRPPALSAAEILYFLALVAAISLIEFATP